MRRERADETALQDKSETPSSIESFFDLGEESHPNERESSETHLLFRGNDRTGKEKRRGRKEGRRGARDVREGDERTRLSCRFTHRQLLAELR